MPITSLRSTSYVADRGMFGRGIGKHLRRMFRTRTVIASSVALCGAVLLSACVPLLGPRTIPAARFDYNERIAQSLLNTTKVHIPKENDQRSEVKTIKRSGRERPERGALRRQRVGQPSCEKGGCDAEGTDRDATHRGNTAVAPRGGPHAAGDRQRLRDGAEQCAEGSSSTETRCSSATPSSPGAKPTSKSRPSSWPTSLPWAENTST